GVARARDLLAAAAGAPRAVAPAGGGGGRRTRLDASPAGGRVPGTIGAVQADRVRQSSRVHRAPVRPGRRRAAQSNRRAAARAAVVDAAPWRDQPAPLAPPGLPRRVADLLAVRARRTENRRDRAPGRRGTR